MTEQQTAVKEEIWTKVEGKNLEKAKVGVIRMSPDVEPEVASKYKEVMEQLRDGKIKGENGKPPMVTWEHGDHVYGATYFTDNDAFSIWRRPKSAGGGAGAKKVYMKLTGFVTGDENYLNQYIVEHPNTDFNIVPLTFADFKSGIQQFIISSHKPVWPNPPPEVKEGQDKSDKPAEPKA